MDLGDRPDETHAFVVLHARVLEVLALPAAHEVHAGLLRLLALTHALLLRHLFDSGLGARLHRARRLGRLEHLAQPTHDLEQPRYAQLGARAQLGRRRVPALRHIVRGLLAQLGDGGDRCLLAYAYELLQLLLDLLFHVTVHVDEALHQVGRVQLLAAPQALDALVLEQLHLVQDAQSAGRAQQLLLRGLGRGRRRRSLCRGGLDGRLELPDLRLQLARLGIFLGIYRLLKRRLELGQVRRVLLGGLGARRLLGVAGRCLGLRRRHLGGGDRDGLVAQRAQRLLVAEHGGRILEELEHPVTGQRLFAQQRARRRVPPLS